MAQGARSAHGEGYSLRHFLLPMLTMASLKDALRMMSMDEDVDPFGCLGPYRGDPTSPPNPSKGRVSDRLIPKVKLLIIPNGFSCTTVKLPLCYTRLVLVVNF
jgi:hypothetical protein